MLLIVGLGNPGAQYKHNRHNVGFMAVDAIARLNGFSNWSRKFQGEVAEGRLGDTRVLLLKPQTYMNLSGQSAQAAAQFHKIPLENIIVLYDELDLAPGRLRVKNGGGSGGHNGIKSLDAHLGPGYRRVRIGIGHPGDRALVHNYVLGDFAKADADWLTPLLDAVAANAALMVEGDGSLFLNKVAVATGAQPIKARREGSGQPPPKGQSHIRQARPTTPPMKLPETGPMAAMLKKLLGKE
ncbi:MAG: aminoacyl-tRNA hydrolase [Rhizobiaceae bacterium]|jgi:PTH1 family peptidyl-tRNA hydrolase|nr:aminoacyl-tRNA hydrolase [Rhizobiaceae bacterium]